MVTRWLGSIAAAGILFSAAAARAEEPPPAPLPPPQAGGQGGWQAPQPYGQPPPAGFYGNPGGPVFMGTGPKTLPWQEGDRVPFGYHLDTQSRKGLVIGGAVTFGTAYMLSAGLGLIGMAFGGSSFGAETLFIPLVGPFIGSQSLGADSGSTALLIVDGVLQLGGAAMLIAGLVAKETVLVRNDVGKGFLMPTPMTFGANSGGIGLVGTF